MDGALPADGAASKADASLSSPTTSSMIRGGNDSSIASLAGRLGDGADASRSAALIIPSANDDASLASPHAAGFFEVPTATSPFPRQLDTIADVDAHLKAANMNCIEWKDLQFGAEAYQDANSVAYHGTLHYGEVIITEWRLNRPDSLDTSLKEFERLVRFMNDLRSPFTMMLIGYSANISEGRLVFVTESFGARLSSIMETSERQLSRIDRFKMLIGASKGLCYLHARWIYYRSFEPANIHVERPTFRTKLGDFTLAALFEKRPSEQALRDYGAPEILKGDAGSLASDVYSLAIVIIETLNGRKPFAPGIREPDPTIKPAPLAGDDLYPELLSTLDVCLSDDPERRPAVTMVTEVLEAAMRWDEEQRTKKSQESLQSATGDYKECQIDWVDISLDHAALETSSIGDVLKGSWRDRGVAVKIVRTGEPSSLTAKERHRYLTKAKNQMIASQLCPPRLVEILGVAMSLTSGRVGVVMELMKESLHDRIYNDSSRGDREIEWTLVRRWLAEAAEGLVALHSKENHHKYLNGKTILITEDDHAKVIFGSLTHKHSAADDDKPDTSASANVGAMAWQAPELWNGHKASQASDVYALAVTAWELAARQPPMPAYTANVRTMRDAICEFGKRPSRAAVPETYPETFKIALEIWWNADPRARPNMATVRQALLTMPPAITNEELTFPKSYTSAAATPSIVLPSFEGTLPISEGTHRTPMAAATPQSVAAASASSGTGRSGETTTASGSFASSFNAAAAGANTTMATRTLTADAVGEIAAKALMGVNLDERLALKFEQALIPWEDIDLGGEVGAGAFGTVIQGEYFSSPVAVKILKPILGRDATAGAVGQFVEEASVLQKVNYMHIVRLMGVCIGEHRYGIVMEFASGGDLGTWLRSEAGQASDRSTRMSILTDVCKGLSYLHKKKIVHRDIKPANILLDKNINPAKLADFGISGLTSDRMGGGTPRYMAPEVIMGDVCTEPSDIFSFGVVIWEVISRQQPYPNMKVNADRTVDRGNLAAPPGPPTNDASIDALLASTFTLDAAVRSKTPILLQQLIAAAATP